MAGHSKWANIKFRKAAQDAKRGKLFTKLIREITVAARMGGEDLTINPRLRTSVDKALAANMTRDIINRAIKRGAGNEAETDLEELSYEGYGPAGVAVMVECLSNNRNRTAGEVRHAFSKFGGNLGTNGSVSYLFTNVGQIVVETPLEDELTEYAIELGVNDIESYEPQIFMLETLAEDLFVIKQQLEKKSFKISFAEHTMLASVQVDLDNNDSIKVLKLLDALEDLDDVQLVHSNANLSHG